MTTTDDLTTEVAFEDQPARHPVTSILSTRASRRAAADSTDYQWANAPASAAMPEPLAFCDEGTNFQTIYPESDDAEVISEILASAQRWYDRQAEAASNRPAFDATGWSPSDGIKTAEAARFSARDEADDDVGGFDADDDFTSGGDVDARDVSDEIITTSEKRETRKRSASGKFLPKGQ